MSSAKADLDLHIPNESLLVGGYEQQKISCYWLLSFMLSRNLLDCLLSCCLVPPADIGMVEVSQEVQACKYDDKVAEIVRTIQRGNGKKNTDDREYLC